MSCSEKEDVLLLQSKRSSQKQLKRSYTREFLLSFCGLDICKKLPNGFDPAAQGELEDVLICTNGRQRGSGDLTFQSLKHGDYGSSPPNSYSRGSSGRWDTRTSRSNSRDGDPSDREAFMQDSGRHFGTQSRRFWQQPEHDGLLGSGAFARPSGYAGPSATKARGPDHMQLNRGSEPYQPPRPYKALPFQRKDNNDSRNDETFGSLECSSEDRAEEERKRRASFELMRKEQQKSLQEQTKNSGYQKIKHESDIIALLEKSVDMKNSSNKNDKAVDSSVVSQNDASRPTPIAQASAYRPLIPPGFASSALEKKISCHSSSTSFASEDGFVDTVNKLPPDAINDDQDNKSLSAACMSTSIRKSGSKSISHLNSEKCSVPSDSQIASRTIASHNITSVSSGFQRGHPDWEKSRENDVSDKMEKQSDIMDSFSQDTSASVLEKLFGTALSKGWGTEPTIPENQGPAEEETLNPNIAESSKFASWFLEEEKESTEDFSSRDLLALIINNDKVDSSSSLVHRDKPIEHVPLSVPSEICDTTVTHNVSPVTLVNNFPEQPRHVETPSNVLSCEQLEQAILSEAKDKSSIQEYSVQDTWIVPDGKFEQQQPAVDDNASQHLLSLLQKSTNKEKSMILPMTNFNSSLKAGVIEDGTFVGPETVSSSDTILTLGTLFGAAFMSELKSAEAPVSIQRVPEGRTIDATNPLSLRQFDFENADFAYNSENYLLSKQVHEADMATSSHNPEANVQHVPVPEMVLGNPLRDGLKLGGAGFEEGALDIHLPEEESLIPGRTSSQLPHMSNPVRPLFPEFDHLTNRNQQAKFIGQDRILHDHYQNTASNVAPHNALRHAGGPRFDPSMHHLMLQQMPIPQNFQPQFPLQGFPRGVPLSHPINHMQGYIPEMNNVHNIALHHRQPNFDSLGKGVPGPMGGGHPEDLQRLIGMELHANSKQVHPVPAAHIPGIYGHDFDMNLRYR